MTTEPLNDPAKRSTTAKRLAREHAQRAALRATKQAMSAAAEPTEPRPFVIANRLRNLAGHLDDQGTLGGRIAAEDCREAADLLEAKDAE